MTEVTQTIRFDGELCDNTCDYFDDKKYCGCDCYWCGLFGMLLGYADRKNRLRTQKCIEKFGLGEPNERE